MLVTLVDGKRFSLHLISSLDWWSLPVSLWWGSGEVGFSLLFVSFILSWDRDVREAYRDDRFDKRMEEISHQGPEYGGPEWHDIEPEGEKR